MQAFTKANLLQHPIPALIWECWRLSRRWYLWVLPAIVGVDVFFMSRAERLVENRSRVPLPQLTLVDAYELMAPSVLMINFTLAFFTTMLAQAIGGRAGFPLVFEYRLPIRTSTLVAVPMLVLATLCASLYFVPMLVCRLWYGVSFPLFDASLLVATLAVILLASSWSTTSAPTRTATTLFALFNSLQLFAWMDPVTLGNLSRAAGEAFQVPRMNAEVVALHATDYALISAIVLAMFALTLVAIRQQRYGEAPLQGFTGVWRATPREPSAQTTTLSDRITDLLTLPCPTRSPWRAELWLELKRHGMPILLLGIVVALAVPLLYAVGISPPAALDRLDYVFPGAVFFGGVGIAIFNRRLATSGYMSPFEGTRAMGTAALALLQTLSVGVTMLCGLLLVSLSVYWSSQLAGVEPGALARRVGALLDGMNTNFTWTMLGTTLTELVVYFSAVALFACLHTLSVMWGRAVPYSAGVIAIYALIFAFRVEGEPAMIEDIKRHMWGFAAIVLLLTVAAAGRTLYLKVLSLRGGLAMLACWTLFVVCALAGRDVAFADQAPELQAFNVALLMLPLMLFALLFWSYDRLRHR